MDKRFLAILGIVVVALGGLLIFGGKNDNTNGGGDTKNVQPTNYTYGEGKSGVVLIEYGDFQCPACKQYYPWVEQLREKYKEQITFQFRHFPLDNIHPNARASHRAAEAAGRQGKFWEMYQKLYEGQESWSDSTNARSIFDGYAKEIGLDLNRFKTDFASQVTNNKINADQAEGKKAEVNSTPTFVLNGQKIENPRGLDDFDKLIAEAIAAKNPGGSDATAPGYISDPIAQ